jgi:hypothetical protein
VLVQVTASARIEDPTVEVDLALQLNGQDIGRVVAEASTHDLGCTISAANVGRILRAGYNRLSIVNIGIRRADPSDARPAGPLAARSAEVAYPVAIYRIRIAPSHE